MADVKKIRKNRASRHLLGPVMSNQALWMLVLFFISIEFVVVPSFSIFDEFLKKSPILFDSIILRSVIELVIVAFFIMMAFRFLKKEYNKWGDTLPLAVKEHTFSQHSKVIKTSSISLIIGLSKATFRKEEGQQCRKNLWEFNLSNLVRLDDPQFVKKWDESDNKSHNWRQPLLCINHFLQKDRHVNVYVFCSTGNIGEFEQFKQVALSLYNSNCLTLKSITELLDEDAYKAVNNVGLDFNNVEEISTCLDKAVRALEASGENTEIVLDVTGGTKLVSVASAIVSFAQGRSFVYIKNNGEIKTAFAEYGDINE